LIRNIEKRVVQMERRLLWVYCIVALVGLGALVSAIAATIRLVWG
jgi:hypothetical protein